MTNITNTLLALLVASPWANGQEAHPKYTTRYFPGRQTADVLSEVQVDVVVTDEQVQVESLENGENTEQSVALEAGSPLTTAQDQV